VENSTSFSGKKLRFSIHFITAEYYVYVYVLDKSTVSRIKKIKKKIDVAGMSIELSELF